MLIWILNFWAEFPIENVKKILQEMVPISFNGVVLIVPICRSDNPSIVRLF